RGEIHADNEGTVGDLIATCDEDIPAVPEIVSLEFSSINLVEGTTYWLVFYKQSGTSTTKQPMMDAMAGGHYYTSTDGGVSWTNRTGYDLYLVVKRLSINSIEADARYAKTEKTLNIFDGTVWNNINDNTGLLDETAHDTLDHTGLTGIPAAEAFTEAVHAETSHEGIAGDKQWKAPVDNEESLPTNEEETIVEQLSGVVYFDPYLTSSAIRAATKFTGNGSGDYRTLFKTSYADGNTFRAEIYSDNDNEPGELLYTNDEDINIVEHPQTLEPIFSNADLTEGTSYWVVVYCPTGTNSVRLIESDIDHSNPPMLTQNSGDTWTTPDDHTLYYGIYISTINSYEGDVRYAKSEKTTWTFDGTNWNQIGDTTGLLDETSHDALDHDGLTGVGDKQWKAPVTYGSLPTEGMTDGDVCIERDSNKIYIFDGDADTPCWRESNREVTQTGITVDASSWREFIISLTDRSMLNIPNFECLITKIEVTAIDGNATPDMDYDIELFVDSEKSGYAYWAQNVTDTNYEDKIPFIYEGGSTVFGRIVNNKASAITDLDITIKFRV
ncbi:MAG: hypothetical protein WDA47_08060, partial [Bacilli bacterium]